MRPDQLVVALLLLLCATGAAADAKPAQGRAALSPEGNVNLGLAASYLETEQKEFALQRAKQAVASDPKASDAWVMLGMVHSMMGQQPEAGEAFARAAKLAPDDGTVNNAYGAWLCEHRSPAEGDPLLRKALASPDRQSLRNVRINAAVCADRAGDHARSEGLLREIVQQSPDDAVALLLLARALHAQKRHFEARAFLQRRESLGPMSREAYKLAVEIEEGAGDARAAARYRLLLGEKYPDTQTPTGEGAGRP
jgi:type IV pilus assembly protein PilF